MNANLMPLFWVAIAFPVLLLMQRWIHTHLHGLALLLTGKAERAMVIYAIILLPGVLLHEVSHWLVATLVGVRTGSFSIIPRTESDGTVQLGYVEYYKGRTLGPIRESLIGGAPLVIGTAVILLIGLRIFGVDNLLAAIQSGDIDNLVLALTEVFNTNDFLAWLYLLFAISNAMMPSRSDRRAWPAFALIMGGLALVLYVLGVQKIIIAEVTDVATIVFGYLGLALSMSIGVDILFILVIAALEGLTGRIRGVSVVYGKAEAASENQKIVL
jgi:hypothetical protein